MNILGALVFFGWIPILFGFFALLPPRRAAIASYVAAWLFGPGATLKLPGIPDYTKVSATTGGILLATLVFDVGRLFRFRPRWYDLPMLAFCACPFASSLSNGLGAYDGASETLAQVVAWGLPYLIGRIYVDDLDGLRELCVAVVVGGLVYIPFCFFEMRMSPMLQRVVYGVGRHSFNSVRFGGYRPRVFLADGLELGMWMAASSLVGWWLWTSGAVKTLRGMSFGALMLALGATTVLCRSTGALLLLLMGMAVLFAATRGRGRALPVWALIAVSPLYMALRAPGYWSGASAVSVAKAYIGAERAQSLEFRIIMENSLAARAMLQPAFGWGGWGRSLTFDEKTNKYAITDGLWIITLGTKGLVGLTALTVTTLLPLVLMLARYPVRTWRDPDVAPAAVLAVLLGLTMIDNISNAMLNPIYTLAMGGLMALAPARRGRGPAPAAGRVAPARDDPRVALADGHAARAGRLDDAGRPEEAEWALRLALGLREAVAADAPGDIGSRRDLAADLERLGRLLDGLGRRAEADAAWRHSLGLRRGLADESPGDDRYRLEWAEAQNDRAWSLAVGPSPDARDAASAVLLAASAVEADPGRAAFWNTLGAARYRAGAWGEAAAALERSAELGRGPNAYDLLFLAMSHARLGRPGPAGECLARASAEAPGHAALARLRAEAASVVGRA